jgi:hypothetical protein
MVSETFLLPKYVFFSAIVVGEATASYTYTPPPKWDLLLVLARAFARAGFLLATFLKNGISKRKRERNVEIFISHKSLFSSQSQVLSAMASVASG